MTMINLLKATTTLVGLVLILLTLSAAMARDYEVENSVIVFDPSFSERPDIERTHDLSFSRLAKDGTINLPTDFFKNRKPSVGRAKR
jgi:hypothetical protein